MLFCMLAALAQRVVAPIGDASWASQLGPEPEPEPGAEPEPSSPEPEPPEPEPEPSSSMLEPVVPDGSVLATFTLAINAPEVISTHAGYNASVSAAFDHAFKADISAALAKSFIKANPSRM